MLNTFVMCECVTLDAVRARCVLFSIKFVRTQTKRITKNSIKQLFNTIKPKLLLHILKSIQMQCINFAIRASLFALQLELFLLEGIQLYFPLRSLPSFPSLIPLQIIFDHFRDLLSFRLHNKYWQIRTLMVCSSLIIIFKTDNNNATVRECMRSDVVSLRWSVLCNSDCCASLLQLALCMPSTKHSFVSCANMN